MSDNELGNWLQERGLGDFTDALASASCEGLEALLELEESSLVAALAPPKEQATALRRLLTELEALRCPPLPASIREKIVELGPQQLACLAAVVDRSPILASPGGGRVLPNQKGELCQPAGRLCARLDSRLWVRKGLHSSRRWYFEIASNPLQVLALPEFASFKSHSQVLLQIDEAVEKSCWNTPEGWMPYIAPILRKGSQVRMQLLVVTGAVAMLKPAAAGTADYEALVMAKEHSLRSYVSQLCFGVRGLVDFGPGEHQCKLTLGSGAAARPVVCKGASLEVLLDNAAQTAVSLSAACGQRWELFQFVTNSLNDLFELVKIDPAEMLEDVAPPDVEEFRYIPMEEKQEEGDGEDRLEVEVMQLYNITLGSKFAGSGQIEERTQQTIELGFRDVATGLADDTGKQVRVAVKQITPSAVVVQLALICAELAEVEQVLATRARSKPGCAGKAEEPPKPTPTEDLRATIGIALPGTSKNAAGPLPPLRKGSKLMPAEKPSARPASPSLGRLQSNTKTSPPRLSGNGPRLGSLPPMDSPSTNNASKRNGTKQKGLKLEPQSVGALAGKIFQALDFDSSAYLTAAKLQWGFEHVAPLYEFACPGFGPSSFEGGDYGSTAHAYYHFLDEDQDGRISEKEFSHLFVKAAELRPAQAAELEGLLRQAHKQLEKLTSSGVVLCATDGQRSLTARSGQQVELIYSVLPERVTKIQSAFKCKEPVGPRALLALLPVAKVVNSIESLLSTAIALTPLDTNKVCGRAVLALPQTEAMMRDCAVRIYILDAGHQFLQVGESMSCQLRGPPSVHHMAANINTALASVHAEEASQQATREYREEAYGVLEQIRTHDLQPEIVVAARRAMLPRLQQVLCSRTLLREEDLVPLSPSDLKVANLGRNEILPLGERPRFQWRVVSGAVGYLVMILRDPLAMDPYPNTGPTFSYFVVDGNLDKTQLEDKGPWHAQFALPELLLGRYVAYVKARGAHGYGAWSSVCGFYSVSAQEVAAMESLLHDSIECRDPASLQEALKKVAYFWVIDEKVISNAKDCLEVIDLENAVRVNMNASNMPNLEKSLHKVEKMKERKPADCFDLKLLQAAALKFGQLMAAQINPMLNTSGVLTGPGALTSLESLLLRLEAIPGNGQEKLVHDAYSKIQLYRHGPLLQEALASQDIEKLQRALVGVSKLGRQAEKQLMLIVNEARSLLRHLCEGAIAEGIKMDNYGELKEAVERARSVNDSLSVQSSTGQSRREVWEANAFGISAKVLQEGENHLDFLKFLHEDGREKAEAKQERDHDE